MGRHGHRRPCGAFIGESGGMGRVEDFRGLESIFEEEIIGGIKCVK
jgi:hypothetical protein